MTPATPGTSLRTRFVDYTDRLAVMLRDFDWTPVEELAHELLDCWKTGRQVFLAGNGGSASNAVHLANDLLYGISKTAGSGLRVHGLPANHSVITCLANDEGYDKIYSLQLAVMARPGDVLIVLSGSGNSPNILESLKEGHRIGMKSFALLGYSGGKAKALCDRAIHFPVDDMQLAEDAQLIVGHMIMQWLYSQREPVRLAAAVSD